MSTTHEEEQRFETSSRAGLVDAVKKVVFYASVAIIGFVGIFPIYWIVQNAFKTRRAINEGISLLPTGDAFTWSNLSIIFAKDMSTYILNSVVVTVGTILAVIVISLVSGYGLARFRFRGQTTFARLLLFGYMFSPIVLALPLYRIWYNLGLLNTYVGLVMVYTTFSMPFAVWLMWKYIQTIPTSMEECSWMLGASRLRGFKDVIVPQTKPAIIANALFAFAFAWNDFTLAQILMPANEKTTFSPGLLRVVESSTVAQGYNEYMAAGALMTIPPLLFAYFLQSYLLEGFKIRSL